MLRLIRGLDSDDGSDFKLELKGVEVVEDCVDLAGLYTNLSNYIMLVWSYKRISDLAGVKCNACNGEFTPPRFGKLGLDLVLWPLPGGGLNGELCIINNMNT